LDDPLVWLALALSIVFVLIAGFFSMSETAFACLNKYRFEVAAENGSRTAKLVLRVYNSFDTTLVTILIAINALSVANSAIFTYFFLRVVPGLDDTVVSLISSLVLTLVVYLFGETIPKQVARKIPNACASFTVYPLSFFIVLLYPLSLLFRGISFVAKKLVHSKPEVALTEEDFTSVIEKNEEEGLLEENESDIIQNSFDFSDTTVREVLTPKKDMFEIDLKGLKAAGLAEIVCSTNYSRIPIYYQHKDNIVGILIVKKFLAAYLSDPKLSIKDYLEKPYIVSPSITIDDLADGFRSHHTQIALVYSKKELVGMATMEDVLEELVGDIGEKSYLSPRGIRS
jgi:putative hemolysin